MIAQWVLIFTGVVSAVCAIVAIIASRATRKLDAAQLEELEKAQQDKIEKLDAQRRRADEEREEKRRHEEALRISRRDRELEDLSRIANERFIQWQDAVRRLDELWAFVEDEMLPWQRKAYAELRELRSAIVPPPQLPRRNGRAQG